MARSSRAAAAVPDRAEVLDVLLSASRAMVGVVARSLAGVDAEITLPQFRTLMVLASRGPQRSTDVAAELGVNPSTGSRMCDRLVRKGLVRRTRASADRRVVRLTLTKGGHALVAEVARHRRAELARLVSLIPDGSHTALVAALRAIANAAGEPADSRWELAWQESEQSGERLAAAG